MNSKQRVMTALNGGVADRVAVFDSFWKEFSAMWRTQKRMPETADPRDYYGIDICIAAADESPFPRRTGPVRMDGWRSARRDGWGRVVIEDEARQFTQGVAWPLREPSDLDTLVFDPPELEQRYGAFLAEVEREQATRCVFCKIGGPLIRCTFLRGEEEFLMDTAADPDFASALIERVADHLLAVGLESLRRANLHDTGIWIYDDMASNTGPMISPRSWERLFLPVYVKLVSALKAAGAAKVIFHSDGNIEPVLPMLIEAGIDGINPVEAKAGMDLPKLKARFGKKLALIGGIDNALVMPSGDRDRIERHMRPVLDAARGGGVIVGAHSIAPDISVESYEFYREVIERYGTWS
jgi:uroporphyrinogen decarboxylase